MIETFVFFDLETHDLPRNNIMPKITELCMVAIKRNSICRSTTDLPRIMCKLLLPINPVVDICPNSQAITRLSNENLKNIKPFSSETYDLCMNFLRQLAQPVCFVAYNGDRFDYPVFLAELQNINKTFSENILRMDMHTFVLEYFKGKLAKDKQLVMEKEDSDLVSSNSKESDILLNDGWDDALAKVLDDADTAPVDFKKGQPRNFKLSTVCEHILGSAPTDMHSAEVDCLAMVRCACQLDRFFIQWAQRFAVPFGCHREFRQC